MHRDLALPALGTGKYVLVEWFLANGMAKVEELVATTKEGGGRSSVGLPARTSPTILNVSVSSQSERYI